MTLTKAEGVTAEPSGDRTLALDASGKQMITLSPVATIIWNHLDEPRQADEIIDHLATLFEDIDRSRLRADADALLTELVELGFVTEN